MSLERAPEVTVPILTFNVPKLDVPKKHVRKAYVPKLSCTESDLPLLQYCGQTAGWMKAPLSTEVDIGAGHTVL